MAAKALTKNQMLVFDESNGFFTPTDLGRIAANYYLRSDSVEVFNQALHARCSEADILGVISCSHEFDGLKVRDEEIKELKKIVATGSAPCDVKVSSRYI
jgi:replicative superfamily II helicase